MYGSFLPFSPFCVTANQIGLTREEEEEEEEEAKTRGGTWRQSGRGAKKGAFFRGLGGPDWRKEERGVFQLSRGDGGGEFDQRPSFLPNKFLHKPVIAIPRWLLFARRKTDAEWSLLDDFFSAHLFNLASFGSNSFPMFLVGKSCRKRLHPTRFLYLWERKRCPIAKKWYFSPQSDATLSLSLSSSSSSSSFPLTEMPPEEEGSQEEGGEREESGISSSPLFFISPVPFLFFRGEKGWEKRGRHTPPPLLPVSPSLLFWPPTPLPPSLFAASRLWNARCCCCC